MELQKVEQLRHRVATVISRQMKKDSSEKINSRMRTDFNALGANEYSYYISAEAIESALLHLPDAILFMSTQPAGFETVAEAIVHFLKFWYHQLLNMGLFIDIVDGLQWTFDMWLLTFVPSDLTGFDRLQTMSFTGPPIDIALNAIQESKLSYQGKDVFEIFFLTHWLGATRDAAVSANALDFFLRVRVLPTALPLYRDPRAVKFAFDPKLCSNHWQCASDLISSQCSASYIATLFETLLF